MKVLMMDNISSTSYYLSEQLEKFGYDITLVSDENVITTGRYDSSIKWSHWGKKIFGDHFDILHINSPNLKKVGVIIRYLRNSKLICHWRGSDIRLWWKTFPVKNYLLGMADFHLYSTPDLHFWLRNIPEEKKMLFRSCVDTDLFKPNGKPKKGLLEMDKRDVRNVPHEEMPDVYNQYEKIEVKNPLAGKHIPSVTAMEAAACGLRVKHLPYLNREWVLKHASVRGQVCKLMGVYNSLIE